MNYLDMLLKENSSESYTARKDFAPDAALTAQSKDHTLLLQELQDLLTGLGKGSKLLLKKKHNILECLFLREGFVCHQVQVKNSVLI
ncbi:MAG TPA: hypothetical protein VIG72_03570, partial [Pontibacter sp.]